MRLVNARTERVVASAVEMAQTPAERRRGLLGRTGLPAGRALVLTPCKAIHTIGMRFAIDVVFVDSRGRVRKIVRRLPPWRMAMSLLASATVELAAGELESDVVCVGDRLYLATAPAEEDGEVGLGVPMYRGRSDGLATTLR